MWKDKLANYLIDISKYILTGVVVASFFKEVDSKLFLYGAGFLTAALFLLAGLLMLRK